MLCQSLKIKMLLIYSKYLKCLQFPLITYNYPFLRIIHFLRYPNQYQFNFIYLGVVLL